MSVSAACQIGKISPQPKEHGESLSLQKVAQATVEIFQNIKETVVLYWNALVLWAKNSWTTSSLVFFRVFNEFFPTLGAKLETGYLYAANFLSDFNAQQKERQLRTENADLKAELQRQEATLDRIIAEKTEALQENRGLKNQNKRLALSTTQLNERKALLQDRYNALVAEKDRITAELRRLKAEEVFRERLLASIKDENRELLSRIEPQRGSEGKPVLGDNLLGISPGSRALLEQIMSGGNG